MLSMTIQYNIIWGYLGILAIHRKSVLKQPSAGVSLAPGFRSRFAFAKGMISEVGYVFCTCCMRSFGREDLLKGKFHFDSMAQRHGLSIVM